MSAAPPSDDSNQADNSAETSPGRVSAGQRVAESRLRRLADLLANSPHNLVARGERATALERHVVECDALAARLSPTGRWLDLGTGGGLPGLVLALRHPKVRWVLVDATAKKVAAVREFAQLLGLTNVEALQGRAELLAHLPPHRAQYDGVVARAVAPLPTLAELARGFLKPGGRLVAMKGPGYAAEIAAAGGALATLGLRVHTTEQLPSQVRDTWVVTMRAEGDLPAAYPRRDGVPKSDPLR